jgi:hypothetical protein
MGELAQVPIEPPEQTELVDATMAIPGVLIAGVPGGLDRHKARNFFHLYETNYGFVL